MIQGRPLNLNWPAEHVPAILNAWYPGEEGGSAIADVLFGDYNPAARLPISVPWSVGQLPVYYNAKSPRRDYADQRAQPLYRFGFGLSYTRFEYSNVKVSVDEKAGSLSVVVKVDVANIGPREGDEVVQLYLRQEVASVTTPERALKAFRRVHLASREKQTVRFELGAADLALLDRNMGWVVEPGTFEVLIGASSGDIREKIKFQIKSAVSLHD
jgi:beta-glucosidase